MNLIIKELKFFRKIKDDLHIFFEKKKNSHYILDVCDIENVEKKEKADFYSLRMNDVVSFVHITRNSAVESIKRNGLIYNTNS